MIILRMNKLEAKFTTKFEKWWKQTKVLGAYEIKVVRGVSMPFSVVPEHQLNALRAAQKGFIYKIPDDSMGQKPCDCLAVGNNGYLVVHWIKRGNKRFYIFPINVWDDIINNSNRKSLTEQMAMDNGIICDL